MSVLSVSILNYQLIDPGALSGFEAPGLAICRP
jgi:hypothetical protein